MFLIYSCAMMALHYPAPNIIMLSAMPLPAQLSVLPVNLVMPVEVELGINAHLAHILMEP